MITERELWDFEQQFLVDNLRDNQHRYGQAFLERFTELAGSINSVECLSLRLTPDNEMARRHVLKWMKKDA